LLSSCRWGKDASREDTGQEKKDSISREKKEVLRCALRVAEKETSAPAFWQLKTEKERAGQARRLKSNTARLHLGCGGGRGEKLVPHGSAAARRRRETSQASVACSRKGGGRPHARELNSRRKKYRTASSISHVWDQGKGPSLRLLEEEERASRRRSDLRTKEREERKSVTRHDGSDHPVGGAAARKKGEKFSGRRCREGDEGYPPFSFSSRLKRTSISLDRGEKKEGERLETGLTPPATSERGKEKKRRRKRDDTREEGGK